MKRIALALVISLTVFCGQVYAASLSNIGFEDGLTGWTATGDAAAKSLFDPTAVSGSISPPQGSLMGCISTSDSGICSSSGADTSITSMLSQSFDPLPAPLTMVANFLTFEFLSPLLTDPPRDPEDDTFTAVATVGGSDVTLLTLSVFSSTFFDGPNFGLSGSVPLTMKQTGFISFVVPQDATALKFTIIDASDTVFTSVALIDAPEPTTLLLLGSGLLGLFGLRKRLPFITKPSDIKTA